MEMEQNTNNNSYKAIYIAYFLSGNLFSWASFFGVVALSVHRFLAIHLHLRYQELVTYKRVVAVVMLMWVFSAFLSLIDLDWISERKIVRIIFTTVDTVCFITTAFLYYKIHKVVRCHANQIQALQVQQIATNGQMINAARLRKTAVGTFYVYLVFLACYLPYTCVSIAFIILGPSNNIDTLWDYTDTLVYVNSSLNPLIYCWKMKHIRHAVMDIMRNAFSGHN